MLPSSSFDPNEFVLLSHVLKPGMVVVDGGANAESMSLFAAQRVGAAGRVIAVEPSSREVLLASLRLNEIENTTAREWLSVPRKAPSSWRSRRRATRARTPSGRGWPTRISRR